MSERLRRLTRNQLHVVRAGSSPAAVDTFFFLSSFVLFIHSFSSFVFVSSFSSTILASLSPCQRLRDTVRPIVGASSSHCHPSAEIRCRNLAHAHSALGRLNMLCSPLTTVTPGARWVWRQQSHSAAPDYPHCSGAHRMTPLEARIDELTPSVLHVVDFCTCSPVRAVSLCKPRAH